MYRKLIITSIKSKKILFICDAMNFYGTTAFALFMMLLMKFKAETVFE